MLDQQSVSRDQKTYTSKLTAKFNVGPETTPEAREYVNARIEDLTPSFENLRRDSEQYLETVESLDWKTHEKHFVRPDETGLGPIITIKPHTFGLGFTLIAEDVGERTIDYFLNLDRLDHFVRTGEYEMPGGESK